MRTSQAGVDFIKGFETFQATAYKPTPNDVLTVGYGHTGSDVKPGMTVDQASAERMLRGDLIVAESAVNAAVKVPLTQAQFDALVSLAFNIGAAAFRGSTLVRKINAGDYAGAAAEFPKWNKQAGRVLNGLTRRREGERRMFMAAA